MTTYVALLRGVNVGGRAKVAMADVRALLETLGFGDIATYLQSGNAIFSARGRDAIELAAQIERVLKKELGLEISVLVRSRDELAAVIKKNPFGDATTTPTQLHAMFLSNMPPKKLMSSLDVEQYEPEEFRTGDRVLYLRLPNGLGRAKLPSYLSEKRLGVTATTRNWNTVTRLHELAAKVSGPEPA